MAREDTIRRPATRGARVAPPARWRPAAALLLSLAGLGVSTYLTVAHFAHVPLACSDNGIVNCERVTHSPQSYVFGIPVAFLGLLFFVAMSAINLPRAWRAADRRLHLLRLAMGVVGMGFVLYLVAAELVIIRNICIWCTSVHLLTFLLFVLLVSTVPPMVGWGEGAPTARDRNERGGR
ncbi:MAG: vitamin K epoxide reductase family protein [Acidimicrobiales bacterium]